MTTHNHQKAVKLDKLQPDKPAKHAWAQQVAAATPDAEVAVAAEAHDDPLTLTTHHVVALQKVVGNQQVARMVAQAKSSSDLRRPVGLGKADSKRVIQATVAEGKYNPLSRDGKRLLAGELTSGAQPGVGKQLIQRQGFTSPITFRQRLFSRRFDVDSGKSLTASINAKRNPEGCQMPDHFIVYLYNVAEDGYETSVRYPIDASAHYTWKGLKGGTYQLILKFTENVTEGCNLNGTLEVKQEGAVNNIVPTVRKHVGSGAWAVDADRPPYGPGTNKCNLFVYEALNEAGAAVQMIERTRWGISRGKHPPLAGQWANPGFSIAGWMVVSTPQPGDVVAEAHEYSDASGHVGIVSSVSPDGKSGTSVSAATSGSVVENDWGFRSGQNVVFRRYMGR